ncbi:hypothetical protein [Tateyamaria pelophila]|uniref:hypothetical protein n=1 Tax=Tateyamaria pelophila TaxID=328415 RepID=UPI001CC09273|nr:hypothetical protein [Tateyamaria pelophila]
MTSDKIAARNRANAQKSTGPKTARGKAVVSRNAQRHGATSKPDPQSVAAWLQIILDDPALEPEAFLNDDRRMTTAMALAVAEVRLSSAKASLVRFENGEAPISDKVVELENLIENLTGAYREAGITKRESQSYLSILRYLKRRALSDAAPSRKNYRLLRRYVREAKALRKKAFQNWLDLTSQTSPQEHEFG